MISSRVARRCDPDQSARIWKSIPSVRQAAQAGAESPRSSRALTIPTFQIAVERAALTRCGGSTELGLRWFPRSCR
jgi:hypothetical protein